MVEHIPIGMDLTEMLEKYKIVIDSAIRNKYFLGQTSFVDHQITRMISALKSHDGVKETILEWQNQSTFYEIPVYDPTYHCADHQG